MHIEFTIPGIGGNVLGGVLSGMLVTVGFIAVFGLLAWAVAGIMSLGSASFRDVFTKKGIFWMLVYIAAGGAVGGLIAATGLPWYVASVIVLLLLIGLHKVTKHFDNKRVARRGY